MKGIKFYFFSGLIALVTLFFAGNLFLKFYFNRFTYETPNLAGISIEEAEILIKEGNFKIKKMGEGYSEYHVDRIYSQLPEPKKIIKKGRTLQVWISKGKDVVTIPDLSELTLEEARIEVEELGLFIENISYTNKDKTRFHQIVTVSPKIGEEVFKNSGISLLVNTKVTGKIVRVPDLVGMDVDGVENVLRARKLLLGNISYIEDYDLPSGVVVEVSKRAGDRIPEGSIIDITINR